ncbi:hypothetical protein F5887DRAFT_1080342 [Amanita rubescens]|nr:hypothetical protein F5887DRAFT_1080342 [Amanita rubescens]
MSSVHDTSPKKVKLEPVADSHLTFDDSPSKRLRTPSAKAKLNALNQSKNTLSDTDEEEYADDDRERAIASIKKTLKFDEDLNTKDQVGVSNDSVGSDSDNELSEIGRDDEPSGVETEDTEILMPIHLRDPKLISEYLKLPMLVYVLALPNDSVITKIFETSPAIMQPYSTRQAEQIFNISYTAVFDALKGRDNEQRLLEHAIKFRFSLPFVNPARASSALVDLDNSRFVLKNPKYKGNNAVFIMTGHVIEWNLLNGVASAEPNMFNNNQAGPLVKRIRVRFFSIEYERFCAFISIHLKLKDDRSYVGPTTNNGVVFSTRKFGFNENSSTPTTPSSNRFLSRSPARSRIEGFSKITLVNNVFPAYLTFGANVPIYDAREDETFSFGTADFGRVCDLPLFKGGFAEPAHEKYIASVGFTVNSFPYNGNQAEYKGLPQVTLNIMFAIVLGRLSN